MNNRGWLLLKYNRIGFWLAPFAYTGCYKQMDAEVGTVEIIMIQLI